MANIPSVNRTSYAYSRLRRRGSRHLEQTEQATEQVSDNSGGNERRHRRDRRRRNIQVLFDRRKLHDRRHAAPPGNRPGNTGNHQPRKGSRINTTA